MTGQRPWHRGPAAATTSILRHQGASRVSPDLEKTATALEPGVTAAVESGVATIGLIWTGEDPCQPLYAIEAALLRASTEAGERYGSSSHGRLAVCGPPESSRERSHVAEAAPAVMDETWRPGWP